MIYRFVVLVYLLTLLSFAFAAQAVDPNWDFRTWAEGIGAFAGGVAAVMTILRRYVLKGLDGTVVRIVAVGIGVGLGVLLSVVPVEWGFDSVVNGAWNGLLAGVGSFLGVDAIRDITRGQGTGDDSGKG